MTMTRSMYLLLFAVIVWGSLWGLEFLHWNRISKSFEYSMEIHRKNGEIYEYLNAKQFMNESNNKKILYLLISVLPFVVQIISITLLKFREHRLTRNDQA